MIMIGINNVQFKAFFFFLPLFVLCRYFYLFQSFEQKKMKEWVLGRVSSGRVAVWMKGNHLLSVYKCRKGTTGHCRSSIKLATWQNNPGKIVLCLCHKQFDVSSADILAILFGYGSFGFGSVLEIDDGFTRRTAIIVAVYLDAIGRQL